MQEQLETKSDVGQILRLLSYNTPLAVHKWTLIQEI